MHSRIHLPEFTLEDCDSVVLRWYRGGKLKLDVLVTRQYIRADNETVDDLEHGEILGRAIITYA